MTEREIRNKKITKFVLALGIVLGLSVAGHQIHQNSRVRFKDPNMAQTISMTLGPDVTPEEVRYKDLDRIKTLNIGFPGNYSTLKDVRKCKNIEKLLINGLGSKMAPTFNWENEDIEYTALSEEEVQKVEDELAEIVPKLKHLKRFKFTDYSKICNITDWDFLTKCKRLEVVWIEDSEMNDFGFIADCKSLKEISLWGSQIETADALIALKDEGNLKQICIVETPLAENYKEAERLCETYPDAKVIISDEWIQNRDYIWWKEKDE